MIRHVRELTIWKRSIELVVETYRLTQALPRTETFGLSSQLRRAAVSIPANIAEGHGRTHRGDFLHHLSIAKGSLREVETYLDVLHHLEYAREEDLLKARDLCDHISRMMTSMVRGFRGSTRNAQRAPRNAPQNLASR